MENNADVQTNEQKEGKQLLEQFMVGEVNILWRMLDAPTPTSARRRLERNSPVAIDAAKRIIASRKKLIKEFKK